MWPRGNRARFYGEAESSLHAVEGAGGSRRALKGWTKELGEQINAIPTLKVA